jgi:hypothetical protein
MINKTTFFKSLVIIFEELLLQILIDITILQFCIITCINIISGYDDLFYVIVITYIDISFNYKFIY